MRFVVVQPGADYSTHDVYDGLCEGLREAGHEVMEYDLGLRLDMADYARYALRVMAKKKPPDEAEDLQLEAGHAIYARVIELGADAVIIVDGSHWSWHHTLLLRKAGLPVVIVATECPYRDAQIAARLGVASLVLANERLSVPVLQDCFHKAELPARVAYLPMGHNVQSAGDVAAAGAEAPKHDLLMVGTGFQERIDFLEAAHGAGAFGPTKIGADWRPVDVGLYGHWTLLRAPEWLKPHPMMAVPDQLRLGALRLLARLRVPGVSPLWQYVRGGVTPNGRAQAMYTRARVNLNLFRTSDRYSADADEVRGESVNPRLYELAALGAFAISEYRPEVSETFGELVPTFTDPAEFAGVLRHYLARPSERGALAAGLPEAAAGHSYADRARRIVAHLTEATGAGSAPRAA